MRLITTFYSSKDDFGTVIVNIFWDYVGNYQVFDVQGLNDLKILTLNYSGGDVEEFELSFLDDQNIRLFHTSSLTTYDFTGRGFIQFLKGANKQQDVSMQGRKRTKIVREKKTRRVLK